MSDKKCTKCGREIYKILASQDGIQVCNYCYTDELYHLNFRLCFILGYATSFIVEVPINNSNDQKKYDWLMKAIENLLYLDKPVPPTP